MMATRFAVIPVLILLAGGTGATSALQAQLLTGAEAATLPVAGFEDHVVPIGDLRNGVLQVALEAGPVQWRPWGDDGPSILAHAFAAGGEAPRVPGPLLRVSAGTPVHVTLRNTFELPLVVYGLQDRTPGTGGAPASRDSLLVAPGGTAEVRFTPRTAGTYIYPAQVIGAGGVTPGQVGGGPNRPFVGVLIVDPAGETPPPGERIFILNHWALSDLPASFLPATRFFINGRSWPHTERLEYQQGDSVRWRVINTTGRLHPMHLHGFYFRVDAHGPIGREEVYTPEERRMVVTEVLQPAETMRITWVPTEPGNWVFHCHFMRHMSSLQTAPLTGASAAHASHDGEAADGEGAMGGLVLGISVQPAPDWRPADDVPRRALRLHIGQRAGVFDGEPGYGFVLQEGDMPPAADSVHFPGSPIVLTRGEPTEITVLNHADVPLGVHWHGLELESWADGVPGWSGMPDRVSPAVQPGDSFTVRMTPPRAGTFMYHVHSEPGHQLAQGLYGPFLVLEPGESRDPETDHHFLLGSLGTGEDPPAAVNGQFEPEPIDLRAGEVHRLRFMHISPDDSKRVELLSEGEPVTWQFIAKDGAELPPHQVRMQPADLPIHVGETYDFRWLPERPGEYLLRITTTFDRGVPAFPRDAPPPHVAEVSVRVVSVALPPGNPPP
jgi:manganese oxidase